jgi:hypothetical protein
MSVASAGGCAWQREGRGKPHAQVQGPGHPRYKSVKGARSGLHGGGDGELEPPTGFGGPEASGGETWLRPHPSAIAADAGPTPLFQASPEA